jgi:hypothetical protein
VLDRAGRPWVDGARKDVGALSTIVVDGQTDGKTARQLRFGWIDQLHDAHGIGRVKVAHGVTAAKGIVRAIG